MQRASGPGSVHDLLSAVNPFRLKTGSSVIAKVKGLVFKIGGLHLDRKMVNSKTIVKFGPELFQQVWLRNAVGMNDMCT